MFPIFCIFTGCHNGTLYKLDAVNGHTLDIFKCHGSIRSSPVTNEEEKSVAVVDDAGCLYYINTTVRFV